MIQMSNCKFAQGDLQLNNSDENIELCNHRRAISSGEPSLDGSIDEEKAALSDSDLAGAARVQPLLGRKLQTLATQAKGPSSDALESECWVEQTGSDKGIVQEGDKNEEWSDILGSGQLYRKVVRSGKGERARNGQKVTIRVVDKGLGIDSVDKQTFILGYSMVIDAWELVLPFMHEGEIDAVKTEHRFAYGSAGDVERNIPPFQSMEYEIELLEIGDWPCYSEKKDLIQFIANLKERGNYYYGRKELEKAVYVYKRCADLVDCTNEEEIMRNLMSIVYSNLSVCYAKLCDWKSTLDASSEALNLNAKNTKALFRRANAYANLNFLEEAIDTLKIAHNIDPDDELITSELRRLKVRLKVYNDLERSLYKRMLAGVHQEDEHQSDKIMRRLRYALLAFFVVVFALFIHFLRIHMGW